MRHDPSVPGRARRAAAVLVCAIVTGCAAYQAPEYIFTSDVTDANRAVYIERFEKGTVLFKHHCAECHGIFNKGKDSVPDFTHAQFDNYKVQFMKGDPKNHAVAAKLTLEQLDYIFAFMRSRKITTK